MPVRTERLAAGQVGVAAAPTVVYTVPAGKTTILKDVRLVNPTGAVVDTIVFAKSGPLFVRLTQPSIAGNQLASLECWVVLGPGDELAVQVSSASSVRHWLSGTELEGVST